MFLLTFQTSSFFSVSLRNVYVCVCLCVCVCVCVINTDSPVKLNVCNAEENLKGLSQFLLQVKKRFYFHYL